MSDNSKYFVFAVCCLKNVKIKIYKTIQTAKIEMYETINSCFVWV
jgi:hypothetical protein